MSREPLYEAPDFSAYQGHINMRAVKDAGYGAVILRAGFGDNNIDSCYADNAAACVQLGIPAGIYWFSYALDVKMAAREAEYALTQAKRFFRKCPVAYDLEYDSRRYAAARGVNIDKRLATDMAVAFLKAVAEEDYIPVLYSNRYNLSEFFDMPRIRDAVPSGELWFALYAADIPEAEKGEAALWQYTSDGRIPGISARVDLNKVYTDIFETVPGEEVEKFCNLYVKNFQRAANQDGYRDQENKKLAEDGIEGPKTQYVMKKITLKAERTEHGYKAGSTGELVRWLQGRLRDMGYDLKVDGRYGPATRAAVIRFQHRYNLKANGIAGYQTIQMLFYS